jgi:hypothetical protein
VGLREIVGRQMALLCRPSHGSKAFWRDATPSRAEPPASKGRWQLAKVLGGRAMSLDGFVSDRNGDVSRLYPDFDELRNSHLLQELIASTRAG